MLNSIVRGFGLTLGRAAATSLITPKREVIQKSTEIECWSHRGYVENDVEILYDYNYYSKQIKWYTWVVFIIPILNLFKSIPYFYNVFIKKNNVYYYDMKWVSFKVSDGRVKGGVKEIQKLQPELGKVEVFKPYLRNKVEALISISISLFFSSPFFYGIYLAVTQG